MVLFCSWRKPSLTGHGWERFSGAKRERGIFENSGGLTVHYEHLICSYLFNLSRGCGFIFIPSGYKC
jgi:hypothetical protein